MADNKRGEATSFARIEDMNAELIPGFQPIIVESRYIKPEEPLQRISFGARDYVKGTDMFVLVHGFQGNALDIRLLRNQLAEMYPYSLFLASAANENATEGCVGEMGFKLS